jgi:hypothetical protein
MRRVCYPTVHYVARHLLRWTCLYLIYLFALVFTSLGMELTLQFIRTTISSSLVQNAVIDILTFILPFTWSTWLVVLVKNALVHE